MSNEQLKPVEVTRAQGSSEIEDDGSAFDDLPLGLDQEIALVQRAAFCEGAQALLDHLRTLPWVVRAAKAEMRAAYPSASLDLDSVFVWRGMKDAAIERYPA